MYLVNLGITSDSLDVASSLSCCQMLHSVSRLLYIVGTKHENAIDDSPVATRLQVSWAVDGVENKEE